MQEASSRKRRALQPSSRLHGHGGQHVRQWRGFGAMSTAHVLALKSDNVNAGNILKIELHGTAPASVLAVASRGNTSECYWKRGFPSGGGVVCDGWDYRTDMAN